MFNIQNCIDLAKLNTLGLSARARNYVILTDWQQLTLLPELISQNPDYFVLGGGSNLILPEEYPGLVIHNQLRGITFDDLDVGHVLVTAMAGEIWDDFVELCCQSGAYGLENLSLIPGTVGAAPVQNIGAYGVEVKDFIQDVTVYDLVTNNSYAITNKDCQFTYRNSRFKNKARYIVLAVSFKLLKTPQLNLNYGDIAKQMAELSAQTPANLRHCIISTRSSKLPDPRLIGNVGSFFHNPVVPVTQARQLQEKFPQLPVYSTTDSNFAKLSAGWLMDNLGLKGSRLGNVGVYAKQALVLVNHGGATKTEILNFAGMIQEKVANAYQIQLNIEPIVL